MHLRRLFSALASHCPSCSRPLATRLPACSQCGTIAPIPPSVGFHELFALPSRPNPFVVDQSLLKRRFREAQAACHPDSWVSKGQVRATRLHIRATSDDLLQKQQDIAQNLSSQLNEAYNALASPLRRAEYILAQNGLPIGEADHLEDIELITEIMEVRESIDEAEDAERLSEIGAENDGKCNVMLWGGRLKEIGQIKLGGRLGN
ncbi:J domain-containing protein [Mycena kentingensis (nom. inval.)]|nr:J domain-containing protein [Mycena kentingensis (nom. inval.)]